jgi:NAD(P)-dependent dehydrogenase (short-subunit alcohol dehydrogenase family)
MEPAGAGMIVLLAPRPRDGAQAGPGAAALENLARTTSVEWARLDVRVVTVRPRDVTPDTAVSDLLAYLASPAGAYFSGCVLDLGAAGLTGYSSASS